MFPAMFSEASFDATSPLVGEVREALTTYDLDRSIEAAERVMQRRNVVLTDIDKELFKTVFNLTVKERRNFGYPNSFRFYKLCSKITFIFSAVNHLTAILSGAKIFVCLLPRKK